MVYIYKTPETEQEWQDYFLLRWEVLRAPWQKPRGSERDELEDTAYHVIAVDDTRCIVGTGRLHPLSNTRAQIRYMAVSADHRGQGIGSRILRMLEDRAINWGSQEIVLNARTTCLAFYQNHDYEVISEAPLLFGRIAHKHMQKKLTQPG